MIKFSRFMQWFCVVGITYDFAIGVWRAVDARWGWMIFEFVAAAWMAFCWRILGRNADRLESLRLERELWS